jgi:UDP-N-acetylmuramyl pentapeptide phosphotransferase/UDP-N-acetylglucosamine-1-phosphate transferase
MSLALLALVISAFATVVLIRAAARLPHAAPNQRSLHAAPVPRVGGLAIWAGFAPAAVLAPAAAGVTPAAGGTLYVALFAVALVSLVDDWRGVAFALRLAVHAVAATAVAIAVVPAREPLALAAAVVAIVWIANLYNFMDGNDGIAGAMTVCGFAAYGIAAALRGGDGAVYAALAAATVPFLVVNFPPARMFLGDVGAVPLGFLAAAFGLAGVESAAWPAWFPWLAFLPFVADATVTLAQRAARRERIWEAHKSHYYQRLHQLGAGHRGTLAAWGGLALGTAGTAVACAAWAPGAGWAALVAWIAVHAMLFATIDYHWRRRTHSA